MGENETGKTSLVAKVKGDDDPKKGQGLEYHAINVRDEDRDEGVQMGVFIVDGDLHHAGNASFLNAAQGVYVRPGLPVRPFSVLRALPGSV